MALGLERQMVYIVSDAEQSFWKAARWNCASVAGMHKRSHTFQAAGLDWMSADGMQSTPSHSPTLSEAAGLDWINVDGIQSTPSHSPSPSEEKVNSNRSLPKLLAEFPLPRTYDLECGAEPQANNVPSILPASVAKKVNKVNPPSLVHLARQRATKGQGLNGCQTVMLRFVPRSYTQDQLRDDILKAGFGSLCDFIYLPQSAQKHINRRIAFVNLCTPAAAEEFYKKFHGKCPCPHEGSQPFVVMPADVQGLEDNIRNYTESLTARTKGNKCRENPYVTTSLTRYSDLVVPL